MDVIQYGPDCSKNWSNFEESKKMSSNNGYKDSRAVYKQVAGQRLDKDDLERAFDNLDNLDQQAIIDQCNHLEGQVKRLRSRSLSGFGQLSAMELVARVGIWMVNNDINPEDIAKR
jgi:hypothetical protein